MSCCRIVYTARRTANRTLSHRATTVPEPAALLDFPQPPQILIQPGSLFARSAQVVGPVATRPTIRVLPVRALASAQHEAKPQVGFCFDFRRTIVKCPP